MVHKDKKARKGFFMGVALVIVLLVVAGWSLNANFPAKRAGMNPETKIEGNTLLKGTVLVKGNEAYAYVNLSTEEGTKTGAGKTGPYRCEGQKEKRPLQGEQKQNA